MIKLTTIQKKYEKKGIKTIALDIKKLEIKKNEFIGIIGTSGSGKSTLLNILSTLDYPTHGNYYYNETDITQLNAKELAKFRNIEIGILVQFFALIQNETVFDNIQLPLHYQKISKKEKRKKIEKIAKRLEVEDLLKKYPSELSGGQQQRIALCRALINKPNLILADEPTGNLDSKNTKIVMDYLKELHEEGHTICFVTHAEELLSYCTRVVEIEDGRLVN